MFFSFIAYLNLADLEGGFFFISSFEGMIGFLFINLNNLSFPFFFGIYVELLCFSAAFDNEIETFSDDYNIALDNLNSPSYHIESATDDCDASCQYSNYKYEVEDLLKKKNYAQTESIIAGTVGVVVWLWNIRDVKKVKSSNYSHSKRFSVGINRYARLEARIIL